MRIPQACRAKIGTMSSAFSGCAYTVLPRATRGICSSRTGDILCAACESRCLAALDFITTLARSAEYSEFEKDQGLGEGANAMLITGCAFHPGFQQIAV